MALPQRDGPESVTHPDHRPLAEPADWCLWDGQEQGVQDARTCTRGQARANYCRATGEDFTTVKVWKRYGRALTLREQYHRCQWRDHNQPPADELPRNWFLHVNEGVPCWESCQARDEGAVPVWVVTSEGVQMAAAEEPDW